MLGNEFATAVRDRASVTFVLCDNGVMGGPHSRHAGTAAVELAQLPRVDWVGWATSMGLPARRAASASEFADALGAWRVAAGPRLIVVPTRLATTRCGPVRGAGPDELSADRIWGSGLRVAASRDRRWSSVSPGSATTGGGTSPLPAVGCAAAAQWAWHRPCRRCERERWSPPFESPAARRRAAMASTPLRFRSRPREISGTVSPSAAPGHRRHGGRRSQLAAHDDRVVGLDRQR